MAERLSRRLSRRDRRRAACGARPRSRAARAPPAHDPVRDRIGQRRGYRRRSQEGRGQAGVRGKAPRHGRGEPGGDRRRGQCAGGRQHLGRRRSARARRRVLRRAHGRGRAAPGGRALCGPGARRFQLCQLLRGRPPHRRPSRDAGRGTDRAAGRLRSRLRGAGHGLVRERARGAGQARRAGSCCGSPWRRHHPRRLRGAPHIALFESQSVPGRDHREHQFERQPLDQADDPSEVSLEGSGSPSRPAIRSASSRRTTRGWSTRCCARRISTAIARCKPSSRATSTSRRSLVRSSRATPGSIPTRSSASCSRGRLAGLSGRPADRRSARGFPGRADAGAAHGLLRKLPPRLYSVASALEATPDEAHLLVGVVRYQSHGRARHGVASGSSPSGCGSAPGSRSTSSPTRTSACPTIRTGRS